MKPSLYLLVLFMIFNTSLYSQVELSINHIINITVETNVSDSLKMKELFNTLQNKLNTKGGTISGQFTEHKFYFHLQTTFGSFEEKFDWYYKNNLYEFFNKLKSEYELTIDSEDKLIYEDTTYYVTAMKRSIKPHLPNSGTLRGRIIDYGTKEPLIGANIIVPGTNFGAATYKNGDFEIKEIPQGVYKIKVSYIAYKDKIIDSIIISKNSEITINVELKDDSYIGEEEAEKDIENGDIFILIGGLPAFPIDFDDLNDIAEDYGFQYVIMGCEFFWGDKYNKKIYEYLDRINGEGWRERMQKEVDEKAKEEAE